MNDTYAQEIETLTMEEVSPNDTEAVSPNDTADGFLSTMKGRVVAAVAAAGTAITLLVPRAAAESSLIEVNFTPIVQIVEGFIGVIPSLVNLIISMVPAILVLGLVGFILMFLDKILMLIGNLINLGG